MKKYVKILKKKKLFTQKRCLKSLANHPLTCKRHAQIKITSHIKLLTLFTASKVYTATTTGNTEKFDFCACLAYKATTAHGASKVFLILKMKGGKEVK